MHPEIRNLLYEAEEHYLHSEEIEALKQTTSSLAQRPETYELLRDQELDIFQPIANQLLETFPHEQQETLERALKHWLSILRYCAMAMLLNNPEFLQLRLLNWFRDYGQHSSASDLYAVGVMLFKLAVGYRPFSGSPRELMSAHLNQLVAVPHTVPFLLRSIISTALQKLPARRFSSAAEMLQVIQLAAEVEGDVGQEELVPHLSFHTNSEGA